MRAPMTAAGGRRTRAIASRSAVAARRSTGDASRLRATAALRALVVASACVALALALPACSDDAGGGSGGGAGDVADARNDAPETDGGDTCEPSCGPDVADVAADTEDATSADTVADGSADADVAAEDSTPAPVCEFVPPSPDADPRRTGGYCGPVPECDPATMSEDEYGACLDQQCEPPNICLAPLGIPICSRACDADDDCADRESGYYGETLTCYLGLCLPGSFDECSVDDDCTNGEACTLFLDEDTQGVAARCFADTPCNQAPGESCDPLDDEDPRFCSSLACARDVCLGFCESDADCDEIPFTRCEPIAAGPGAARICSPVTCDSDEDCSEEPGHHCEVFPEPSTGTLVRACVRDVPGGAETGEPCNDDLSAGPLVECKSGLCVDNRCSRACEGREDCGDSQRCDRFGFCVEFDEGGECSRRTGADVCRVQLCGAPDECPDGTLCRLGPNSSGTRMEGRCVPPVPGADAGEIGDPCEDAEHGCASGLCLEGLCSGPCAEISDCGAGQECALHVFCLEEDGGRCVREVERLACVPEGG